MGTARSLGRMAVASAAAIPRFGAAMAIVVVLAGCTTPAKEPRSATAGEVTTSLASLSATVAAPVSSAGQTAGTSTATASKSGQVPISPMGSDSDLVRDELPGYTAQELQTEEYALRRSYVPADPSTHDLLMVVAHRYVDAKAAQAAIESRVASPQVAALQGASAAGLPGYSFLESGETVLVLRDGSLTLELRVHPGRHRADLRKLLVDVAETVLD